MESTLTSLTGSLRSELLHVDGVSKFSPNRRFATIFSEGSPAESLFYVESGLVKLFKRGEESKEIIIDVISSGALFGEQALTADGTRNVAAEVLQEGAIYVIPRDLFIRFLDERPQLWRQVAELLVIHKKRLEKKIELLCLHDVEYRILYYLADLAGTVGSRLNNQEFSIPLSQGELASLIGATRETTSTTLNALARRGLIRLGRRQLIVISLDDLRSAAKNHSARAAAK
jgi:CRP-like cAMP-binding protein